MTLRLLTATVQGRWYVDHGMLVTATGVRRSRFGLGSCHANARWLARRWPDRFEWWSGYAVPPRGTMADNHSWVRLLVTGEHHEVTYDEPAAWYLGVPVDPAAFDCPCTFHPNECTALRHLGRHGPWGGGSR